MKLRIANEKKKVKRITLAVSLCLLLMCIIFIVIVCIRINYIPVKIDDVYDDAYLTPTVEMDALGNEFKVLKISDTHLVNGKTSNDIKTLSYIESVLDCESYDLIILNGDLVYGFTLNFSYNKYTAIDAFAKIVEFRDLYWTFVPGNNDGEIQGDNKRMISYLMRFEHFITGNTAEVEGDVNFVIDVKNDGIAVHSIVLLDSHSRKIPVIGGYEHLKESQMKYLKGISRSRNDFISLFFHMPSAMFGEAYENGVLVKDYRQTASQPYDRIISDIFDRKIADCNNISLISCSHIHSNNMLSFYNDKYYELNSASGFGAKRDGDLQPAVTQIKINLQSQKAESLYEFTQF